MFLLGLLRGYGPRATDIFCVHMLGVALRALHILSMLPTTELHSFACHLNMENSSKEHRPELETESSDLVYASACRNTLYFHPLHFSYFLFYTCNLKSILTERLIRSILMYYEVVCVY